MVRKINGWLEDAFTSEYFTYRQLRGMFFTLVIDQFFIIFINTSIIIYITIKNIFISIFTKIYTFDFV